MKNQRKIGVILTYAGQMVHILSGLIYTPVMLRLLGQSEYGLYQLVYSVVSNLGLLSFGFSASYMRFYSREKVNNGDEGVARINGMFLIVFCVISVICLGCGLVMLGNIKAIFGTRLTETEYMTAKALMGLMIVNMALSFPDGVFNCIIASQEKFIFQKSISLLNYLLNPFLTLPLLLMGYGSIAMVSVTTFLRVVFFALDIFFCMNKLNSKFRFKNLNFSLLREMWVFTIFIFINQIVDQINWTVDKFLLGRMIGTKAVAIYGVGGQINNLYISLSLAISAVFVPKINSVIARAESDNVISQLFIKVGRMQFIMMAWILSGFVFWGQSFIFFWAGKDYTPAYYVTLLLITPVTIPSVQNLGIEIQRAKNKHKARAVVYFIVAIMNVCLSIPLIRYLGPFGAALGTCIAITLGNILFMNWYYYRYLNIDIRGFWRNILSFFPALVVPIAFGIICLCFIKTDSVGRMLMVITIYSVIYFISIYFWGMNSDEKKIINIHHCI